MKKVLFILKYRKKDWGEDYNCSGTHKSSGLSNSATFVCDMLLQEGYNSKLVHVVDNNQIDREVTKFKPEIVIIEAYWVIPEKFIELSKRHPRIKWIIRNHSKTPFLSNESIAIDWSLKYLEQTNVFLSANNQSMINDLRMIAKSKFTNWSDKHLQAKIPLLPNYYPLSDNEKEINADKKTVDIGCFGAIRPLKNQLIQALAAIKYAQKHNKKLRFHINSGRVEGNANNILENIRNAFKHLPKDKFELVEHGWYSHNEFKRIIRKMEIGLQVSFSESFNIVAADFVDNNIPVVVSSEIDWIDWYAKANPTDIDDIVSKIENVVFINKWLPFLVNNKENLQSYNLMSMNWWHHTLCHIDHCH